MSKHTDYIQGLRFQKDNTDGRVHVHDSQNVRFEKLEKDFKKEVGAALGDLTKVSAGAVKIGGPSATNLFLLKDDKKIFVLVGKKSVERELNTFLRSL